MITDFNITPNFTFSEVTFTRTSIRNIPLDAEVFYNLFKSVEKLQSLRDNLFHRPIHINSGYRSYLVNKAVNGVRNSDHVKGFAFDIRVNGLSPDVIFQMLHEYSKQYKDLFGQVILYGSFVHVSFNTFGHHNEFIFNNILK